MYYAPFYKRSVYLPLPKHAFMHTMKNTIDDDKEQMTRLNLEKMILLVLIAHHVLGMIPPGHKT